MESKHTPVYAGKYTFVQPGNDYKVPCLRYKEPWFVFERGAGAINALLNEFAGIKEQRDALLDALKEMVNDREALAEDEGITACQCMGISPDDITPPEPCSYCKAKAAIALTKKEVTPKDGE